MTPGIIAVIVILVIPLIGLLISKILNRFPKIMPFIKDNLKIILPVALVIITVLFFTMIKNHEQKEIIHDAQTGSKYDNVSWGDCRICGAQTTLKVGGSYYCSKHYGGGMWKGDKWNGK